LAENSVRPDVVAGCDEDSGPWIETERLISLGVTGEEPGITSDNPQCLVEGQPRLLAKQPDIEIGNVLVLTKLSEASDVIALSLIVKPAALPQIDPEARRKIDTRAGRGVRI
jgi:hypothetical protein